MVRNNDKRLSFCKREGVCDRILPSNKLPLSLNVRPKWLIDFFSINQFPMSVLISVFPSFSFTFKNLFPQKFFQTIYTNFIIIVTFSYSIQAFLLLLNHI